MAVVDSTPVSVDTLSDLHRVRAAAPATINKDLSHENTIVLVFTLALIGFGIFLGVGIRTKSNIIEKPITLSMTEKQS